MKRTAVLIALFGAVSVLVWGQDATRPSLAVVPGVEIPLGPGLDSNDGDTPYTVGGGADLLGTFDIGAVDGAFLRAGVGYALVPVVDGDLGSTDDLTLLNLGAGPGYGLTLGTAGSVSVDVGLTGGVYQALVGSRSASNLYTAASLASSFALSPSFSIGASAEYGRYFSSSSGDLPGYLYDGVSIGLNARYTFGGGPRRSLIEVIDVEIDRVYPILHGYYDSNPVGSIRLRNGERSAIENVSVSLYVPQYMDRPKESPLIAEVARNETIDVPLYALFTDEILEVTEDGKRVSAEVRISYEVRGTEVENGAEETAIVQNRNALTWTDDRKAAAFVTAKDNTILRLAKQAAGTVRELDSSAIDDNFRTAVGVYETLGLLGMQYVIDPDSSYIELSQNAAAQDYVQFPAQTLDYRAGDCDDLSILYTALLQAVNVDAAFITVPGHIYTAFGVNLTPSEARRTFADDTRYIVVDDTVWIPVEATIIDDGFQRAWEEGIRQWREHAPAGRAALYPIEDAWREYAPVASPLAEPDLETPAASRIAARYEQRLQSVVQNEIRGRVARLERQVQESGGNPAIANRLGVLYARYGLLDDALIQFRQLADRRGYAPAMINVGNIYYMRGEYARALRYYTTASERMENNQTALLGIARAQYGLENYGEAERTFTQVASVDPSLAERFPHLGNATDSGARASAAAVRAPAVWEE